MASSRHLLLLLALLLLWAYQQPSRSFARFRPRRTSDLEDKLPVVRTQRTERQSTGLQGKPETYLLRKHEGYLPPECKHHLTLIGEAAKQGPREIWAAFRNVSEEQKLTPVYNAAMSAMLRQRKFQEGVSVYLQLCKSEKKKTPLSYIFALRLLARMGNFTKVELVWEEAQGREDLMDDQACVNSLTTAMLDACGHLGQVDFAESLLDKLHGQGLSPNDFHYGAAMHACQNARQWEKAQRLLDRMLEEQVYPNIVVFTNLMGAHWGRPVKELERIRDKMSELGIEPNKYLIEQQMSALANAHVITDGLWETTQVLNSMTETRRLAMQQLFFDARKRGIRLTALAERMAQTLSMMGET